LRSTDISIDVDPAIHRHFYSEKSAKSMIVVVLVVHVEYIHPERSGVRAATDFGLTLDVYVSETDALK
jgi:hypothetical protein